MCQGLDKQFAKSKSRYQFNIDRIAEKYCNASNKRELAFETLHRDFGNACISSPVVELKDESSREICQRLNKDFEMEYGKRLCLSHGGNTKRSAAASYGKFGNRSSKTKGKEQLVAVEKYASKSIAVRPDIVNMLTNSVQEESYEAETDITQMLKKGALVVHCTKSNDRNDRYEAEFSTFILARFIITIKQCIRSGLMYVQLMKKLKGLEPLYDRVIDVITSPIKEGPVKIHMNNQLKTLVLRNAPKFRCLQSSSSRERFVLAKNETFLDAWFRNAEKYWANESFVPDHSFRWRAAYHARRTAQRNLGYVNMSDF